MMNVKKLGTMATVFAAGMFAFGGAVQAASVAGLIFGNGGDELDNLDDFSVEYVVDAGGDPDLIEVDDLIRGAFTIDNVNGMSVSPGNLAGNEQMTGVFSLKVDTITPIPADPLGRSTLGFTTDPGFDAWATGTLGGAAPLGGVIGDPIVRFFTRPVGAAGPDYQGSVDPEVNTATAAVGDFLFDVGFGGASGVEGWVATGGTDLTSARMLGTGVEFGEGRFALSLLADEIGLIIKPQDLSVVDPLTAFDLGVLGSGLTAEFWGVSTVNGAGGSGSAGFADNGFDLTNNTDLNFVAVPMPAAAGSMLAMMGLIALRRRRAA